MFWSVLVTMVMMAIFLGYTIYEDGSLSAKIEKDEAEYRNLMYKIEKKHREARGEIGLRDEDNDEMKKDK